MESRKMLIGGSWVDAVSGATFDDFDPYTMELYAKVAKGDARDADKAMAAAYAARKPWAGTPPLERAKVLYKAASLLEEMRMDFAGILTAEGGGTFGKAMFEISQTVDLLETAAADCKRIMGEVFHTDPSKLNVSVRRPKGTVVAISPWNFPLILSMYKVAYALAAGNTVVFKPASDTPVLGLKIGELFLKAGLVAGALNVVTGPGSVLGDALIDDERCSFVTLTGETVTGAHVAQKAAAKMKGCTLELGGKNPLVILADADLDLAVDAAAFGSFMHQGQICMCTGRLIVEDGIVDEFAKRFAAKAKGVSYGDPKIPTTVVGPLINDAAVKKIDGLVKDAVAKGAKLLAGGSYEGRVYRPTVLSGVTKEMRIYDEEIFGPVAPIIAVKDADEALAVANDTKYGLSAAIVTRDFGKAMAFAEGVESGMVHVNDSPIDAEASVPFGGSKWSGLGREGGAYSIEEMTEVKWVTYQKGRKGFPF